MVFTEEETRERKKIRSKKYYENNKEKQKKYQNQYHKNNKEYYKQKDKEYRQTPKGKKSTIIGGWKEKGLICEDYDSLYCHYLNTEECDNCNVLFGERGDGTGSFKCMDHDHKTGLFRNFLCCRCNLLRGE